jgi:hypothetical protein
MTELGRQHAPAGPTIVSPLIFSDRATSQSSMTRTMSVNDQSFGVTLAAIAGVIRRLCSA